MNDSVITSIYLHRDTAELLREMVHTRRYKSASQAVNAAVHTLDQVEKYKHISMDPVKMAELQRKIKQMVDANQIDHWAKSLSNTQIDGFMEFLQLEKRSR